MRITKREEQGADLIEDIVESARSLYKQDKFDPYRIEIVWEAQNDKYDIHIDVSITPREAMNGNNYYH